MPRISVHHYGSLETWPRRRSSLSDNAILPRISVYSLDCCLPAATSLEDRARNHRHERNTSPRGLIFLLNERSYSLSIDLFPFLRDVFFISDTIRTLKQFLVKSGTVFNRIRLEPPFDRLGDRCSIPSRLELIWTFARRAYLGRKSDRQLHMMDTLIIESGRGPRRINSRYARSNPLGGDPLSLNTRRLINLYRSFQFSRLKIFRDGRKYARYEKCLSPVITFAFLENKRYILTVPDIFRPN